MFFFSKKKQRRTTKEERHPEPRQRSREPHTRDQTGRQTRRGAPPSKPGTGGRRAAARKGTPRVAAAAARAPESTMELRARQRAASAQLPVKGKGQRPHNTQKKRGGRWKRGKGTRKRRTAKQAETTKGTNGASGNEHCPAAGGHWDASRKNPNPPGQANGLTRKGAGKTRTPKQHPLVPRTARPAKGRPPTRLGEQHPGFRDESKQAVAHRIKTQANPVRIRVPLPPSPTNREKKGASRTPPIPRPSA